MYIRVSRVQLFATPWAVVHQTPLSMEFSRQEYWSGLPCPSLGDLPHPGIKPPSPAAATLQGGFFTTEQMGQPKRGKEPPKSVFPKCIYAL